MCKFAGVQVCRFASCASLQVLERAGVHGCKYGKGQVGCALTLDSICNTIRIVFVSKLR